jgi:hypothetical protein
VRNALKESDRLALELDLLDTDVAQRLKKAKRRKRGRKGEDHSMIQSARIRLFGGEAQAHGSAGPCDLSTPVKNPV